MFPSETFKFFDERVALLLVDFQYGTRMVTMRRSSNQFTGMIVSGSLGFSNSWILNKIEWITSMLEPLLNRLQVLSPICCRAPQRLLRFHLTGVADFQCAGSLM